ncbi:MAG: hypothetical protein JW779_14075 [Candidatus Thorarchaeota archaeon]|nr:hypothetical protein [Candidatus Thorarchaeota archaeon]
MDHHRSILIICCLTLVFGMIFASPSYSGDTNDVLSTQEDIVVEGERQFGIASAGDDYVDSVQSLVYGTHSTLPPTGMGADNSTHTTLTEASFVETSYTNLMTQSNFGPSAPSGWTATGISYSGGYFEEAASAPGAGEIFCSTVDTSSYDGVRFTLNIECSWTVGDGDVVVYFWDGTNWDSMGSFTQGGEDDQTFFSSSSQYQHSAFRVKVGHGSLLYSLTLRADNWRIDGQSQSTYYRFEAVYKFTGVDSGTYYVEELYVDFDGSSSSEALTFYFASGDTTPDNSLGSVSGNSDTYFNIHSYLTGSECYVKIRDTSRTDPTANTWRIDRLYIRLTNTYPTTNTAPVTSGLVNTDDVLAEYNYATTSVTVEDLDGYSQIDNVTLSVYDDTRTTNYFTIRYEQGGTFSVTANPDNVILGTCSAPTTSTSIDVQFNYTIPFDFLEVSNVDYYILVYDGDAASDSQWYEANWDTVTTLALDGSLSVNDGAGTPDRGNMNSAITASGTIIYSGATSYHPRESLISIQLACANITGSPWSAGSYNPNTGYFSASVTSDDDIGRDVFTLTVSVDAENKLDASYTASYISDQIICASLSSPSFIVDSYATGYMTAQLQYAHDGTNVTDGGYELNGLTMSYQGNDIWMASYAPNALTYLTYDSITVESANTHGITSINMNTESVTIYWDQLVCYLSNPTESLVNPGTNASGIYMWAEYYYASLHPAFTNYDGTLHANDTIFVLYEPGQKGYKVSSADGNDALGIFTIYSSNATYCIWDYLDPAPSWDPEPTNQISEFLTSFLYNVNATTPSGLGKWLVNDTSRFTIDSDGIISNISTLAVGIYPLWIFVNDTFGRAINQSFLVTVEDTTIPSWLQDPELQTSELGDAFYYDLNATDASGLHSWWLNTTDDFDIGPTGIIENARALVAGTYGIRVYVNDTYDNILYADLAIVIEDTTNPVWTTPPADKFVEFGDDLDFQLAAYDLSILSNWWVNDTTHFSISGDGLLENAISLPVGEYIIRINVTDAHENAISSTMKVTVQDTTAPSWDELPVDKHLELDFHLVCDINATDLSGSVFWYVNDTMRFSIDAAGIIRNATTLEVGTYPLTIGIEDIYSNYQNATFLVIVEDQTPPTWDETPADIEWEFGKVFQWDLNATDLSGLDTWWLNDTDNFEIDDFGVITNTTVLPVGSYGLHIFVNDTFGEVLDVEVTVFITDTTAPTDLSPSSPLWSEFGDSIAMQFSAFDLSGISQWTVTFSTYFSISTAGLLTNKSSVPVGEYTFNITVFDEYDNWNCTEYTFVIEDTTYPEWTDFPETLQIEYGDDLYYRLKATDLSESLGLEWRINDEVNFSIDIIGMLRSEVNLVVGDYPIIIEVEDFYGNILEGILIVQVRDTTPPNWIVAPQNRNIPYGTSFTHQMSAGDTSGIVYWFVSDTEHFIISDQGFLENNTVLGVGIYTVNITISDMYDNSRTDAMTITVQPVSAPSTTNPTDPGFTIEQILLALGVFGVGIVIVVALSMTRIRKFVEQRTASMMEGKEDLGTALDYLDKIQEDQPPPDED